MQEREALHRQMEHCMEEALQAAMQRQQWLDGFHVEERPSDHAPRVPQLSLSEVEHFTEQLLVDLDGIETRLRRFLE
jgi:hypothetical protein